MFFFGFIIILFTLLLLITGRESIELSENEVTFKFQRLIPVCERIKSIKLKEINSIQFSEGKIDDTALLLNILIEYIPGTIRSDDDILVELSNGEIYRHHGVGRKIEIINLIEQINKKIRTTS